jgi:hypothetical protein
VKVLNERISLMNDAEIEVERTEDAILSYQVSDEALESAAGKDNAPMWTLGACTGISVCPG